MLFPLVQGNDLSFVTAVVLELVQLPSEHERERGGACQRGDFVVEGELSKRNEEGPVLVTAVKEFLDDAHAGADAALDFAVRARIVRRDETLVDAGELDESAEN